MRVNVRGRLGVMSTSRFQIGTENNATLSTSAYPLLLTYAVPEELCPQPERAGAPDALHSEGSAQVRARPQQQPDGRRVGRWAAEEKIFRYCG